MFFVYDVINRRRAALKYYLFHKIRFWKKTHDQVDAIIFSQLENAVKKIKSIDKCINEVILKFERQIQIVAASIFNFIFKCHQQITHMKALMLNNDMSILWITLNSVDFRSSLMLSLTEMRYDSDNQDNSLNEFCRITAIANSVTIALFFHHTCRAIFDHLLAANNSDNELLNSVSTYFETVEINDRKMLHLHCLIWL